MHAGEAILKRVGFLGKQSAAELLRSAQVVRLSTEWWFNGPTDEFLSLDSLEGACAALCSDLVADGLLAKAGNRYGITQAGKEELQRGFFKAETVAMKTPTIREEMQSIWGGSFQRFVHETIETLQEMKSGWPVPCKSMEEMDEEFHKAIQGLHNQEKLAFALTGALAAAEMLGCTRIFILTGEFPDLKKYNPKPDSPPA